MLRVWLVVFGLIFGLTPALSLAAAAPPEPARVMDATHQPCHAHVATPAVERDRPFKPAHCLDHCLSQGAALGPVLWVAALPELPWPAPDMRHVVALWMMAPAVLPRPPNG